MKVRLAVDLMTFVQMESCRSASSLRMSEINSDCATRSISKPRYDRTQCRRSRGQERGDAVIADYLIEISVGEHAIAVAISEHE